MSVVGTTPAGIVPKGYEQLTVTNAVKVLVVPAGTTRAVFGVEAQPLRYRTDGTDASASVGHLVAAAGGFEIYGKAALEAFTAFRDGGSDATLDVTYYGYE